jgi:hypothetical protein
MAATDTVWDPPPDWTEAAAADSEYVQGTPCCVRLKVNPAIVSVPVREKGVVFAAAKKLTDPEPLPCSPDVMLNQPALLRAVHAQPLSATTEAVPLPPAGATVWLAAARLYSHGVEFGDCTIVKSVLPTRTLPARETPVVFAAMVNDSVPVPAV